MQMVFRHFLRFFIYWKQKHNNRTDIDLSVAYFDKSLTSLGHVSWTNLREGFTTHSGDITSAPDGASEFIDINIKKAIETALANEVNSVAFCGFSGGSSYDATIPVHVKENNYGIVEDCHQMIMHMIAQNIRHKNLLPDVANPYPF